MPDPSHFAASMRDEKGNHAESVLCLVIPDFVSGTPCNMPSDGMFEVPSRCLGFAAVALVQGHLFDYSTTLIGTPHSSHTPAHLWQAEMVRLGGRYPWSALV